LYLFRTSFARWSFRLLVSLDFWGTEDPVWFLKDKASVPHSSFARVIAVTKSHR
jgi:hypothetical protein